MASKDALLRLTTRLTRQRNALRQSIECNVDSLRTVSTVDGVGDQLDAAVDAENNEICSQLVELESRELSRIEHALQGIATGNYGRCEYCGSKISAARLSALPYTNSCIDCQRKKEKPGNAMAPDSEPERWSRVDERSIDDGDCDVQIDLDALERESSESR
jgi:DnaK suppressor protein